MKIDSAEVLRMAEAAGMFVMPRRNYREHVQGDAEHLERFAAMVAAAQRELIAQEFDKRDTGSGFYEPHEPAEIIRVNKD